MNYIYARSKKSVSLDRQVDELVNYCSDKGVHVEKIVKENRVFELDKQSELIKDVKDGKVKNIYITDLSVISRSIENLKYLSSLFDKHNTKVIMLNQL